MALELQWWNNEWCRVPRGGNATDWPCHLRQKEIIKYNTIHSSVLKVHLAACACSQSSIGREHREGPEFEYRWRPGPLSSHEYYLKITSLFLIFIKELGSTKYKAEIAPDFHQEDSSNFHKPFPLFIWMKGTDLRRTTIRWLERPLDDLIQNSRPPFC